MKAKRCPARIATAPASTRWRVTCDCREKRSTTLPPAPPSEALTLIGKVRFRGTQKVIAADLVPEIEQRLRFMDNVGLGYLALGRSAKTLSGGESQRIRLAAQLGSNLRGVLYVLDEPTIGLHSRDNVRLLETLSALREKGNSLVIVEHDEETMRRADHIIDLGPGAGVHGGEVVAAGHAARHQGSGRLANGALFAHAALSSGPADRGDR